MKVTVERKALADAAKAVGKFLPKTGSLPAINHYLVEAHSGILALTATDMEAGRRIEVEADVKTEGDILVPPILSPILASGAADEVELSATDQHVTVKIGKASHRIRLGKREDYPTAEPSIEDGVDLPVDSWHKIQAVARIASTDTSRPVLQAVCFEGSEAIATDSYRLAHVTVTEKLPEGDQPNHLVPARAILGLDAAVTKLTLGERQVKAQVEDGAWWARLIEAKFPNWRNLEAGTEPTVRVRFLADRLAGVLSRARHVTGDYIPLRLTVTAGEVVARANRPDIGEFEESFSADTEWSGKVKEVTVGFNDSYLASLIDPVDEVTMTLSDGFKASLVSGDGWWSGLIMPVRL